MPGKSFQIPPFKLLRGMDKKATVLIIDDHTLIRESWSLLLSYEKKFDVIGNTGDGDEAIEIVRRDRPELVLLDINMGSISGFDLLKQIRKYSPGTKVIGISMHSQPAYARKMIRGGAKGYVTKNSTTDELLTGIKEVLAGNIFICSEVKNILGQQLLTEEKEPGIQQLTSKELEVIQYLKEGLPSKDIATKMNVATKTIEVHRHNIFKKLGVKNVVALVQKINQHGL